MTTVININTGAEITYSLPPEEAVVVAHQQFTKKNFSFWSYDLSIARRQTHGWACGDFWAAAAKGGAATLSAAVA